MNGWGDTVIFQYISFLIEKLFVLLVSIVPVLFKYLCSTIVFVLFFQHNWYAITCRVYIASATDFYSGTKNRAEFVSEGRALIPIHNLQKLWRQT